MFRIIYFCQPSDDAIDNNWLLFYMRILIKIIIQHFGCFESNQIADWKLSQIPVN